MCLAFELMGGSGALVKWLNESGDDESIKCWRIWTACTALGHISLLNNLFIIHICIIELQKHTARDNLPKKNFGLKAFQIHLKFSWSKRMLKVKITLIFG
jgi:hypothetical protein